MKCTGWILNWWSAGGTVGTNANLTFQVVTAPDNGAGNNTPGTFAALNQSFITSGSNPQAIATTATPTQGIIAFYGYFPYLNIQVTSYTNGSLFYNLTGYINPPSINSAASTVTAQLCTNCSVGSTPTIFGPVPQVGQNQHRAVLLLGGACAGGSAVEDMYFQASYDGTHYFEIGTPQEAVTADKNLNSYIVTEADGAFPYVELVFTSPTGTCNSTNIWYTGSIRPNASDVAVLPRFGNRGMQFQTVCASSATTTAIVAAVTTRFPVVYGWEISEQGTASAVNIQTNTGNNKVAVTTNYANAGPSGLPLFSASRGGSFQLVTSGTNLVCLTMQFRYEDNPQ